MRGRMGVQGSRGSIAMGEATTRVPFQVLGPTWHPGKRHRRRGSWDFSLCVLTIKSNKNFSSLLWFVTAPPPPPSSQRPSGPPRSLQSLSSLLADRLLGGGGGALPLEG